MWVYDTADLAFLAVNEAALSHYGYSRDEFLSMTLRDIRPLTAAHNCTRAGVGRNHPTGVGQRDLSWNRQWKPENGPRSGCRAADRAGRSSC